MRNLIKLFFTLQIIQKYRRVPLQYKLLVMCLFPLIIFSSCSFDPSLFPYENDDDDDETIITVQWDPNDEPDLAGYRVYYGETSGSYTEMIDVGNTTSCTIEDLSPGVTYYITATAYNSLGYESNYSDELIFSVPSNI